MCGQLVLECAFFNVALFLLIPSYGRELQHSGDAVRQRHHHLPDPQGKASDRELDTALMTESVSDF